ncbi:uncharacterized protein BX664DRAFT_338483 [Halteromyces radiatus]|uniref:uncharacterized protein n=1 Tax=Halteromyces radiatus TaxID=101107 RepID=UPI00221E3864|nr:uncharacterized protein BX664DRAFT_338483 [Halteromyces radiatus]KAI8085080.1 hypothetical protein BX664DRAFT_338483 [Halteromyces radiatus]
MTPRLLSREKSKEKSVFPTASTERRTIYVNMDIPPDELDDYGQPTRSFIGNKIRTAKYTWYTFLPKNLFEQFRGIANLYFLFLVILQMFPLFSTSASPILVILPLAAILVLTGAKDAVEDNKRHKTDQDYDIQSLHRVNTNHSIISTTSTLQPPTSPISSIRQTIRSSTTSFTRVFQRNQPYRPGLVPHSVLHRKKKKHNKKNASPPVKRKRREMDKRWKRTLWQDLQVGDFVFLRNDDPVPADMVILSTSEPDGLCYVETQNLDGETNLKIKRGLQATSDINRPEDCENSSFYIESEAPHANLYSYNGVLKWKVSMMDQIQEEDEDDDYETSVQGNTSQFDTIDDNVDGLKIQEKTLVPPTENDVSHEKTEAITGSSVLLRGCVLRNTDWVIGMVLFTGNETKIMLNSGKTPSKRSKMEKATNPHVIANFVLLFVLCLICSIAATVVYSSHTSSAYFEHPDAESATMEGFLMFWTTLVIYQNIIPISLYISVQIVKTAAAYFIHTDIDMYNERLDQPCIPKTWNISDDLGQIEYIFSDKTGTLTQNIMEFRRCTINGVTYGLGETEASLGAKLREDDSNNINGDEEIAGNTMNEETTRISDGLDLEKARREMLRKQAALFEHHYVNPKSSFVDPKLYDDLANNDIQSQSLVHFFSALAFCHTVIAEIPDPDKPHDILYKAQSPDEAALVATARDVGFTFVTREQDTMIMDAMGERREMTLLHVLEFNSTRKRMSVIMRGGDGRVVLICKGADSVIYERLDTNNVTTEQQHIRDDTLKDLATFANEGLRTLCIASRVLDENVYQDWAKRYKEASNSIHNRDEQMESVCEDIEQQLTLIGGTAIEDKLQEGVPDTIAVLAKAGIKIWVLTGDKIETAINIGFACNLLTKDMLLLSVNAHDEKETLEQLRSSQQQVNEVAGQQKCALVIDGESLKYALEAPAKEELLRLGTQCMAVVCCRVSPMQKAKVVNLVKKGLKVMTLSIGDGANDVSMIQEANVGVGISGEEGRQAVMASDYAIAQFRYLSKLLLVHGRWSYLRTSEMILTFFYKNIMWTLVLFWYQLFCGFSGTMMFDYSYITLYNLVFTSLPCIFAGVLDQDLKAEYSFKFPQLYLMGIRNDKFKTSRFYLTVFDAIYQSAICFGIPYMLFIVGKMNRHGYDTEGVYELGTFIAGIAVVVANALVGFTIFSYTWVMVLVIVVSSATFFIWTGVYAQFLTFNFYGEDILFRDGSFWLCLVITFVICMLPRFVTKYYLHMDQPFDNDIVRELVLCNNDQSPRRASYSHFTGWKSFKGKQQRRKTLMQLEEEIPITLARTQSDQSSAVALRGAFHHQSQFNNHNDRFIDEATMTMMEAEYDNVYPLTEPSPAHSRLDRTGTGVSGKSEIMYMRSGKRASFTGFAYSSDDASAFDAFRKSVYRGRRRSSGSDQLQQQHRLRNSYAGVVGGSTHLETANSSSTIGKEQDWMPLDGFRLRRYETEPDPHHITKKASPSWVRAVKQRMATSKNSSVDHELVDISS